MKIFVNTLERFAARRAQMSRQLDSLGLAFEYFEGPDGKNLTKEEMDVDYDESRVRKNLDRVMSLSEIACTMAHRDIYRKMLKQNIEKACILEDDVLLDPDFPRVLAFLEEIKFRNTVVKLDNYREKNTPCSIWTRRPVNERLMYKKPVTAQWMTWGYVIDQVAAESILRAWPKIEFVCDDWARMAKAIHMRCIQPAVVHDNLSVPSNLAASRKEEALGMAKKSRIRAPLLRRLVHVAKTVLLMVFS
jgi:glycosyl transferase, family 25